MRTVKQKVIQRIEERSDGVFMRSDFFDLASYRQIGDVIAQLVHDGFLIRVSHGMYVRAKTSSLTGNTIPVMSLREIASKALERLGVDVCKSQNETGYNYGVSNQVPTGRVIGVNRPVHRKIGYDGKFIIFEVVKD